MRKFLYFVVFSLFAFKVSAAEINAENLALTSEQSQQLAELQEKLKAEIQPIWEEVESGRHRIIEIEKQYFQAFWNILTEEQKQKFADLQR